MNVYEAWELGYSGKGVQVAVLDDGIDMGHPDLMGNYVSGFYNLVLIAYASSEGSGEPAHPRSLARTFAARSYKQWVKRNLQTESQIPGPSEWLGMRS